MIFPTTSDLTKGKYNRYEVALATAKCARMITNEYVRQRAEAESSMSGNKETDRPLNTLIDKDGIGVAVQPVGNSLRLQCRQDDVLRIGDDNRAGFAPAGDINDAPVVLRVLDQALDGCRIRADHCNDFIRIDNIAKTDMYKLAQSCFRLYSIF